MFHAVSLTLLESMRRKSSVFEWCFSTTFHISGIFLGGLVQHQPLIAAKPIGVKNSLSRDWVGPGGAEANTCGGGIGCGQDQICCGGTSSMPNVEFNLCFSYAFVAGS